jgi:class 3 adenylate cyclase/tetratricopeptide (TPR) repeat protein
MACAACGGRTTESDRFCANCGTRLRGPAARQEARKKVSILFMDIVGSTQLAERLDPEPLRQIMDRYFAACADCVTEHGGAVEKFIGDAIMAAFGAAVAHEDDAVRAVRAAVSALAALRGLSAEFTARYQVTLEARCGICTGDVVVITSTDGDFRIIGDTTNTASRLQTAALPGQILLDADTATMVRSQVSLQPVEPLRLKGKARPVPAYQVIELEAADDVPAATPFIGREDELADLRQSYRRAVRGRQVCLVTMLGVPGIGKSRLVQEFVGTLPAGEATVLAGRCSAYGRGITYKPLADMLGSFPGGWPALAQLLEQDSLAARTLATLTGADADPVGTEDIAWAFRSLLELLGQDRPVILIWEDLHWAEETLLDLIDEAATWLTDVPVLMLCLARGELLEARRAWGGGKPSALTLELGPMTYEQSAMLVGHLTMRDEVSAHDHSDVHERIATQCDGNPLFAELITDVFTQIASDFQIPPTIQALLGARLDQLPGPERTLVELAAMIGRDFTRGLLQEMAGADQMAEPAAAELITSLIRHRILLRGPAGTIRFAQTLLRDTAYEFTPKTRREQGHDFLARWYAEHGEAMAVAYHVEAAWRLSRELRPGEPALPRLAAVAAGTLCAEGMDALSRKDLPAAIQLLERARRLLPAGDTRHTALALHICDAALWLLDSGKCLSALEAADALLPGDRHHAVTSAIERGIVSLRLGLATFAQVAEDASAITADLEDGSGDHLSWCRYHQLRAHLDLTAQRFAAADTALRLGLTHARARADRYEEDMLLCAICELAQWAPTPVATGMSLSEVLSLRFAANRALLVPVLVTRVNLLALAGQIDDARRQLATAAEYTGQLHLDLAHAAVLETTGLLEALSGRHDQAEAWYRRALSVLEAGQQAPDTQNIEVLIARELFEQGHLDEAALVLHRIEIDGELSSPRARIAATALRGRIASATGRSAQAIAAAMAARSLSDGTDDLCLAGETTFDLAVVLRTAGRDQEARDTGLAALRSFEAKGAAMLAGRVRDWLSAGTSGVADLGVPGD